MFLKQTDVLEVQFKGAGGNVLTESVPRLLPSQMPIKAADNIFKPAQSAYNAAPIAMVGKAEAAPMEVVPTELTQDEQLNTSNPTTKIKAMQKLKDFISANGMRALAIGAILGAILGFVICKKSGKSSKW